VKARYLLTAGIIALGFVRPSTTGIAQGAGYVAPTAAPMGQPQTVKINQGLIRGAVADGVGWFLGIPYAPPPVGPLRWQPPGAAPIWSEVRDGTRAGAVCTSSPNISRVTTSSAEPAKSTRLITVLAISSDM